MTDLQVGHAATLKHFQLTEAPMISEGHDLRRGRIQSDVDLGFAGSYLHRAGRNQREWMDVFAAAIRPALAR